MSKEIEAVEREWHIAISQLTDATSEKEKTKLRDQLPYLQTRMELAMKKRLVALEKSADEKVKVERVVKEFEQVIEKIESDCKAHGVKYNMKSCFDTIHDEFDGSSPLKAMFANEIAAAQQKAEKERESEEGEKRARERQ